VAVPFPAAITSQVVSDTNRQGTLNNSNLEMAAVLLQYMILKQEVDLWFVQAGVWSDKTPSLAWTKQMADPSQAPTAGQLLRGLAAVQHSVQGGPVMIGLIAGKANDMADVTSQRFDLTSNTTFLTHFTTHFPLPQQQS
jgi:hypothetical protein